MTRKNPDGMTPDEYIKAVLLTEAIDFDKIKERLSDPNMIRMLHAAMGLCTESGEFMDALKKTIFYGKKIDLVNLFEELGDLMWYIALAMDEIGLPMEECFERNIAKLQARYKDKFTETKAENRDLAKERQILEGAAKDADPLDSDCSDLLEKSTHSCIRCGCMYLPGKAGTICNRRSCGVIISMTPLKGRAAKAAFDEGFRHGVEDGRECLKCTVAALRAGKHNHMDPPLRAATFERHAQANQETEADELERAANPTLDGEMPKP